MIKRPMNVKVSVRLDWKSYFHVFDCLHEGSPVVHEDGNLLYRDGWKYSSTSYDGIEIRSPSNLQDLLNLQLFYWSRRKEIVSGVKNKLEEMINSIQQIQSERSAPLQQRISYTTEIPQEDGSVKTKKISDVSEATEQTIRESRAYQDAEYDLKECEKHIEEITRQLKECSNDK